MPTKDRYSLSAWIEESIRDFAKSPENTLGERLREPAWETPLVGFASGDAPLFRKTGNPPSLAPREIFARAFPDVWTAADQLTVIAWVLPHTKATKAENRKEKLHASERWALAMTEGERFNQGLRAHLIAKLAEAGYRAMAPRDVPSPAPNSAGGKGLSATWSERHAAFVSGLGTFGLCDSLITPAGKAVRCGSVIARIAVPAPPRPYDAIHAYCLFFTQGVCGKCITRCPAGAISREGHDRAKCRQYLETVALPAIREEYGIEAGACGLCQTKVPCESRIPASKAKGEPIEPIPSPLAAGEG
jgi:epoxyqueuosine reductase QueG